MHEQNARGSGAPGRPRRRRLAFTLRQTHTRQEGRDSITAGWGGADTRAGFLRGRGCSRGRPKADPGSQRCSTGGSAHSGICGEWASGVAVRDLLWSVGFNRWQGSSQAIAGPLGSASASGQRRSDGAHALLGSAAHGVQAESTNRGRHRMEKPQIRGVDTPPGSIQPPLCLPAPGDCYRSLFTEIWTIMGSSGLGEAPEGQRALACGASLDFPGAMPRWR